MKIVRSLIEQVHFSLSYVSRHNKAYIMLSFMTAFLSALISILDVYTIKYLTNALLLKQWTLFLLSVFIILGLSILLNQLMNICLAKNEEQQALLYQQLNIDLMNTIKTLPYNVYDQIEQHNQIYFITNQGATNLTGMVQSLADFVGKTFSLLVIGHLISQYDSFYFLLILILVVLDAFLDFVRSKLHFKKAIESILPDKTHSYLLRLFYLKEYAIDLRLTQVFRLIKKSFQQATQKKKDVIHQNNHLELWFQLAQLLLQALFQLIILIRLAFQYFTSSIGLGDFFVLYNGTMSVTNTLSSLVETAPQLYQYALFVEQLKDLLNKRNELPTQDMNTAIQSVRLEHVSFSYNHQKVIQDFSYTFEVGKCYWVSGVNGCGKSTLLKLIAGLLEPQEGAIYLNHSQSDARQRLTYSSYLGQNSPIYAFSLKDNLLMGKLDQDFDLSLLGLQDYQTLINQSLTTELDEQGLVLSGGQQQRLLLLRTLIQQKPIMLIDEPTNQLDQQSKQTIYSTLKKACQNSICIIVSHDELDSNLFDDTIHLSEKGETH